MLDKLKARIKKAMDNEMILKDGTQVEFGDGELTLVSKDGQSVTLDSFATSIDAEDLQLTHDDAELTGDALDAEIVAHETALEVLKARRDGEGRHVHQWQRGELPGGVKVRTCKCGATEKV
jgi:hypothetical protein